VKAPHVYGIQSLDVSQSPVPAALHLVDLVRWSVFMMTH
jgi:hypothetical protein